MGNGVGPETGDSPHAIWWRNARFVSVADDRNDRGIERVEGFCPVGPSPFAPLDVIHRWWRRAYHRLMAWIPPGSRYAIERDCRRLFFHRGGSYLVEGIKCRFAARNWDPPGDTYYYLGFRVALEAVR
jgi:hypothetical protein